ncbi:3-oxoacyl-ACP synthase [Neisseria chenwenguii]|uniref:3-oxoacyl-ACP synthase n=1 Tax=Neisseria chenwenguii TaxID=1853278 RepID=A0A220S136_9NEIS|nr:beta-ketoacyl synthase chain length factor [Neisseria chenwenguii]ASK26925.1 3-oxoacyl-ACP synthase [Neisseria chenwenguii]
MDSCCFSFNIKAWNAASSRIADKEQWRLWAEGGLAADAQPEHKPAVAFLPAMQRRRLGLAARLMFEAAWPLAEEFSGAPLVFVSHDGELNRSFELWPALICGEGVSPTSFGLSVHNALAGQWSVQRGDMSENTALAVGADGFENALAECYAMLCEGAERVLLVAAEDPLKSEYALEAGRAPFPYAAAFLLEKGSGYSMALAERPSEKRFSGLRCEPYWGAIDWLKFMLDDKIQTASHTRAGRHWQWRKP